MTIRLFIADDHAMVRAGLRRILTEAGDVQVVGEAGTADEMLRQLEKIDADVALLDVSMPGPGIIEVLRVLRETSPRTRALVLSMHPEEQYARRVLRAGAAGYVTKDQAPERLVEAIRKTAGGGHFVSPRLAEALAAALTTGRTEATPVSHLSDREFEVLRLIGTGWSVKKIASELGLSHKTVSTYRVRLREKLGLRTTAELIRFAIAEGLVE
ncbi:MAG: response regulator [Longimicrobiales bacterium]